MRTSPGNRPMWKRNLLFIGLVAAGLVMLTAALFPPSAPPRVRNFDPAESRADDFRQVVDQVDGSFRRQWSEQQLKPAPHAPDLTVARRLSLALTGTIPSLQEIRQLEAQPDDQRLAWWLAGIFQDRRYADYFAERLTRSFVGVEDGPF